MEGTSLIIDYLNYTTGIRIMKCVVQGGVKRWLSRSTNPESEVVERPSLASCPYAAGATEAVDARTVPAPAQAIRVPTVCQAREDAVLTPAMSLLPPLS